jgi:hypothetical protein
MTYKVEEPFYLYKFRLVQNTIQGLFAVDTYRRIKGKNPIYQISVNQFLR